MVGSGGRVVSLRGREALLPPRKFGWPERASSGPGGRWKAHAPRSKVAKLQSANKSVVPWLRRW